MKWFNSWFLEQKYLQVLAHKAFGQVSSRSNYSHRLRSGLASQTICLMLQARIWLCFAKSNKSVWFSWHIRFERSLFSQCNNMVRLPLWKKAKTVPHANQEMWNVNCDWTVAPWPFTVQHHLPFRVSTWKGWGKNQNEPPARFVAWSWPDDTRSVTRPRRN